MNRANEASRPLQPDGTVHLLPPELLSGRWYQARDYGTALNLANNLFVHPLVHRLFAEFLANGLEFDAGYTRLAGLRRSLAMQEDLPGDCFFLSPGSDIAIRDIVQTLGRRASALIQLSPNYPGIEIYAVQVGLRVENIPHAAEHFNSADFLDAIRNCPGALVAVTNPNPAHGGFLPAGVVEEISKTAARHGSILLVDAAYADFAEADALAGIRAREHTMVVRSYSKSHGLAGMRAALVVAGPRTVDHLARLNLEAGLSSLTARFLEFCLEREPDFAEARAELKRNRERLSASLGRRFPEAFVAPSQANFTALRLGSEIQAGRLHDYFQAQGIAVRHLRAMWPDLDRWIRVTSCNDAGFSRVHDALGGFHEGAE